MQFLRDVFISAQLLLSGSAPQFSKTEHQAAPESAGTDMDTRTLFGGELPWNETGRVTWVSVDDRVRGGSSVSHFDPLVSQSQSQPRASVNTQNNDARFWGALDTQTLGGAGFASSTTNWDDKQTKFDLRAYDGVMLKIRHADDKLYTFIVKDDVPPRRPDGRMESGINWEYDFEISNETSGSRDNENGVSILIPWDKLKATYRGRDVKNPEPLKVKEIRKFSIMMRSFFEKQSGDFELVLHSIAAFRGSESSTDTIQKNAQL